MKLFSLAILSKPPAGADGQPVILAQETDVDEVSWLYRSQARDGIKFLARELVNSQPCGARCSVQEGQYHVHLDIMPHGLAGVAVTDADYPERVVFMMLHKLLGGFENEHPRARWQASTQDLSFDGAGTARMLADYQTPERADPLMAVRRDLDETLVVMHTNIEQALKRGANLEELVERSVDLSTGAKKFYRTAKKTNSCC
jgi:synaptobrevin family protein YKT6